MSTHKSYDPATVIESRTKRGRITWHRTVQENGSIPVAPEIGEHDTLVLHSAHRLTDAALAALGLGRR